MSDWLEQPVPYRLALLLGPPGSGKSPLLKAWVAQRQAQLPGSTGLLRLTPTHNQPRQFLRGLWAAFPGARDKKSIPFSLLGEEERGWGFTPPQPVGESIWLEIDLHNGMVDFLNALDAAGSAQFFLVLDDYHVIENPAVHAAVSLALDYLPPQALLVIASRTEPPLPLARLRSRRLLKEITIQELGA